MTDEERDKLILETNEHVRRLSAQRLADEVAPMIRMALLVDQSHHWWREGQRPGPERDVARANAALAWAFLQAEMRAA